MSIIMWAVRVRRMGNHWHKRPQDAAVIARTAAAVAVAAVASAIARTASAVAVAAVAAAIARTAAARALMLSSLMLRTAAVAAAARALMLSSMMLLIGRL